MPPKEKFMGSAWLRARLDLPTIQRLYEEEIQRMEKISGIPYIRSAP